MKWTIEKDFVIFCPWLSDFECEWGNVKSNWLTIYKGYSWDGCTPKFHWGFFSFGVWDGPINLLNGKQWCYYATLVHDFIYQFELGMRWQADRKFKSMLRGFKLQKVYYLAVRVLGRRW